MSTTPVRSAPVWLATVAARLRAIEAEPMPANIGALMDTAAGEVPERISLHFIATGEELTYTSLLEAVGRTANGLRANGVTRGARVAVMLPNLPAMPITWLALARIGAVMVPVNTRYTGHELDYVLQDSGAIALVIHVDFLAAYDTSALAARLDGSVFVVGGEPGRLRPWSDLQAGQPEVFFAEIEPALDDLMNIQYTSGTTGLPKGCMLSQRYWLTCARSYSDSDGLSYRHILAGNPFFYMTPQWLTLMAFFQRATLHVGPHRSLTRYMDWIRDCGIEFCLFPSNIHDTQPPHSLDSATRMRRGNLYIHHPERHAEMQRRFGFPLRTAFGMTEIGMGLSMPLEAEEMTGSGSCGIAGPFREVRIADTEGRSLSVGEAGELLIRGPGILQGYWKKPEATAGAFHGDWFRTGDLARQDEHGFVWIIGRLKDMVRRAGENIAAAEVEAAIASLAGVQEAVVMPVPDELRGEEVKVYIRLKEDVTEEQLPPAAIIAHCRGRLASFKVPRYIEYRRAPFPLSAAGSKVDKPALRREKSSMIDGAWDRLESEE